MSRALSLSMAAEIARETGETVYLVELQFSGGTVRLTSAARNISWNSQTWTALGGNIEVEPTGETPDGKAQGCELTLSGVDLTIMALILAQNYRGRLAKVYFAHVDRGTNLALRSEDLDHANWTRLNLQGVTANAAADDRGRLVLDKLIENTAVTVAHLVRQAFTIAAAARLWSAVEIRLAERSKGAFYIDNAAFTSRMGVNFDLVAETTSDLSTGSGVLDASAVEDLGGGLYRVWIRGQVDGASTSVLPTVRLADNSGNLSYTGDGTSGFHAGKVQLAESTVEVPYAPAADAARHDGVVTPTPLLIFSGYMNETFEVSEERSESGNTNCRITTRLVSRLAGLSKIRGVLTNLDSHQSFYSGDTFFQNVPGISGREVIWGHNIPHQPPWIRGKAGRRSGRTQ